MSDAAKALDDFDHWLAPIHKLAPGPRFAAICNALPVLRAKAKAVGSMAVPADVAERWTASTLDLATAIEGAGMCCSQNPKPDPSPTVQAVQDDQNATCVAPIHEELTNLVALVPGAKPVDSHAADPAMPPPPGSVVNMAKLRAAVVAAHAELATAASAKAATAAALCATGRKAVDHVEQLLEAPGLPPGHEAEFRDLKGGLLMDAGSFYAQHCGAPPNSSDLETVRSAIVALRDKAKQLVALTGS